MVQRPARIAVGGDATLGQQGLDARRQLGRAGRGVLQRVELGRKAAEVVPGHLPVSGGQGQAVAHPVRRHHQNRAGLAAQGATQAASAGPVAPGSTASMGEPWETKSVGQRMAAPPGNIDALIVGRFQSAINPFKGMVCCHISTNAGTPRNSGPMATDRASGRTRARRQATATASVAGVKLRRCTLTGRPPKLWPDPAANPLPA